MNCTTEDTCKISKPMARVFLSSETHSTWMQLQPYKGEGCSTEIWQDRLWRSTFEMCCCHIHAQGSTWFFFWSQRQTIYFCRTRWLSALENPIAMLQQSSFLILLAYSQLLIDLKRIQEQILELKMYAAALKPRCMLLLHPVLLSGSEGLA